MNEATQMPRDGEWIKRCRRNEIWLDRETSDCTSRLRPVQPWTSQFMPRCGNSSSCSSVYAVEQPQAPLLPFLQLLQFPRLPLLQMPQN